MDVAALQVTPVHYLFKPDEQAMVDHFRRMADETGMPIIIYNVVPWSYLSPALLTRIMNEVPLVVGVKQSAGDLKLFADLMMMAPDKLIYSAVDALMYSSYTLGAHGSIAAILSAAPHASVAALGRGQGRRSRPGPRPAQKAADAVECDRLGQPSGLHPLFPVAAGTAENLFPRPMPEASPAQQAAIRAALEGLGRWAADARGRGIIPPHENDPTQSNRSSHGRLYRQSDCYCPVRTGSIVMRAPIQK